MTKKQNNEVKETEEIGKKNVLFSGEEIDGISISGYDFNNGVNYEKLFDSFGSTGFQATHFAQSIDIIRHMIESNATIYLGYTSNIVTSGVRDVIRYLAEHKKIKVIVTTAGGIEEDFIKCLGEFKLGKFSASGELLNEKGVNRAGNIYIPNTRYCEFEEFMTPILEKIYDDQKKTGKVITVSEFIRILGREINDPRSIYYWCYKNDLKVYCPAIIDGSIGDMIHFFMYKHPDFKLDIAGDVHDMNEFTIVQKKTGIIILGGGVIKHHINNANMMRNGTEFAVYINTMQEWDGSDAGARPDEAVSWGKIKPNSESVKVFGDATILFPLIVAKTFAHNN